MFCTIDWKLLFKVLSLSTELQFSTDLVLMNTQLSGFSALSGFSSIFFLINQSNINDFIPHVLGLIFIKELFYHKRFSGNNFITHFMNKVPNQMQRGKYEQLYHKFLESYSIQEQILLQKEKYWKLYHIYCNCQEQTLTFHYFLE